MNSSATQSAAQEVLEVDALHVGDDVVEQRIVEHQALARDDLGGLRHVLDQQAQLLGLFVVLVGDLVGGIRGQALERCEPLGRIRDALLHVGAQLHHALEAELDVADTGGDGAAHHLLHHRS